MSSKITPLQALLIRQQSKSPKIIQELNYNQKKISHWIWWVFPTTRKGTSEPKLKNTKTCIEDYQINELLEKTNIDDWIIILKLISQFIYDKKSLKKIIPEEDHGRMEAFYLLFLYNKNKAHREFFEEIKKQQELFYKYKI